MKILVCVKQVGTLADELELTRDARAVDPDFLDYSLNEWDACAIEAALALRDASGGGEVVAVTVGDDEADSVLHRALAMGADRGIRLDLVTQDPLSVARALAPLVAAESPDLVLAGVLSADLANGAVPGALAGLAGLPFVAVAVRVEIEGARLLVSRELEGGLVERVALDLPAVVSVQTGINAPRYVNFRQLKQAEATDLDVRAASDSPGAIGWQLAAPERGEGAEMLPGRAGDIAARILELVAERRS